MSDNLPDHDINSDPDGPDLPPLDRSDMPPFVPKPAEFDEQSAEADEEIAPPADDIPASDMPADDIQNGVVMRSVEDLTLAEMLGQLLRSPLETVRAVTDVATTSTHGPSPTATLTVPTAADGPRLASVMAAGLSEQAEESRWAGVAIPVRGNRLLMTVMLYLIAFGVAVWGGFVLISSSFRVEQEQLADGTPFLVVGLILWLFAELYRSWPTLQMRFFQEGPKLPPAPPAKPEPRVVDYDPSGKIAVDVPRYEWLAIHPARVFAILGTVMLGMITWFDTAAEPGQINQFKFVGFWAWVGSIVLVIVAFAPLRWLPQRLVIGWRENLKGVRLGWTFLALVAIMLVGLWFRVENFAGVPPEMTSDHIEKLLDAQRVVDGSRDIFFANNGGREPFQMYALALMSQIPGLEMNFDLLKLLAVIEGVITLPVLWLMGWVVIGQHDRRLGNIVGLLLALLVAVSYWHVSITRLSLRIVLTPLVASLLVIFLTYGIRTRQRGYYILAGLTLGFGLYTYQAVRMLPLVVVAAVMIAMIFNLRNGAALRKYIGHLTVVVIVSFVVFVPMFRYSMDYSDEFWSRTSGRLFGDDLIFTEDPETGEVTARDPTFSDRANAFVDNLPALGDNMRNALLMYNWKGDVGWINGVPNDPSMDPFTGALLILGIGAWAVLIIRKPDPIYVLMPVMVLIMLLPSALSIAAPLENPSATRMSGTLPPVYLIAALPLALIAITIWQALRGRIFSGVVAVSLVVVVAGAAYAENRETYLEEYLASYEESWTSHSLPGGILEGFVESDGAYGNAFMIGFQHWLDHRIIGAEAGVLDWVNGIAGLGNRTPVERIPDFLNDAYRCDGPENPHILDPERDLLFFFNQNDDLAAEALAEWFPAGQARFIEGDQPRDHFFMFRVPALGQAEFEDWLATYSTDPRCVV